MTTNKFRIVAGLGPRDSSIELNGERLSGVTRVSFDMNAKDPQFVRLEIIGEVEVEGEFVERVITGTEPAPDQSAKALVADLEEWLQRKGTLG